VWRMPRSTIPGTGLRLRATGTANVTVSSVTVSLAPGADVVVEGFDLATGTTLWSCNAGSDGPLLYQTPTILGPTWLTLWLSPHYWANPVEGHLEL
jgi:hypothetical protein